MAWLGEQRRDAPRQDEWLTLGQAAKYLGVAQSTMRKWSDSGRVSAFYTPGGHRRYRRSELDQFLDRSGRATGEPGEVPLVLIVDDDAAIREFVRVNLEAEGYEVREAGSAQEGLEALDDGAARPDPARRDDAAGRRLGDAAPGPGAARRRRDPGRHVQRQGGRADEAVQRGAQGFVGKPFDPRELIDSTKQLLPV